MDLVMISIVLVLTWCQSMASGMHVDANRTSLTRLVRLYPISLYNCMDACLYNDDCHSIAFNRLANLCDLQNLLEPTNDRKSRGSIFVTRGDILKRGLELRNSKKQKPVHIPTKACRSLEFPEQEKLGNTNRVGDRIIVDFENNESKCMIAAFACTDDGRWLQTDCRNHTSTAVPRDCGDIVGKNHDMSDIYLIYPNDQDVVEVYCDLEDEDGPWTVIQRRVDGTVDFNRNYKEYQEGFGNLLGNFWLGLESISRITMMNGTSFTLKVILNDTVEGQRYAKYSRFRVLDATKGYMLLVGGYSGNAGDSLTYHTGCIFTTYDHDPTGRNCAAWFSGGWWFNYCHVSNMNGQYGVKGLVGIHWKETTGTERSATFATLKVKKSLRAL